MNGLVDIIDRYGSIDDMPKPEQPEITLSEKEQISLLEKLKAAKLGDIDGACGDESFIDDENEDTDGLSSVQLIKARRKRSDKAIERYLIRLTEMAMSIDDKLLAESEDFDQYEKMYLFYLKYGDSAFVDGTMKKGVYSYNGYPVLEARDKNMFRIESVTYDKEAGTLTFEGQCRLDAVSMLIGVNASVINAGTSKDDDIDKTPDRHDYALTMEPYPGDDVRGFASEPFITGQMFSVTVKVRMDSEIRFMAEMVNSAKVNLKLYNGEGAGFGDGSIYGYRDFGDFILRLKNTVIYVEPRTEENLAKAEELYLKDELKVFGEGYKETRKRELELKKLAETGEIVDRTLFVTTGSELNAGLKRVYDLMPGEKAVLAAGEPWDDETREKAIDLIFHSKTVVMDSPVALLKKYRKREGQRFIQLWHGIAAFRKICGDEPYVLPYVDALYHRDYDMLAVSSYRMKDIYAKAMRVDPSRIAVTGSADSDDYFDTEKVADARQRILEAHPELEGKQVFLYIPAAAERDEDISAVSRKFGANSWSADEGLNPYPPDYDKLSEKLGDGQIFAVCPDTSYISGSGRGTFIGREEAVKSGFASRFIPKGNHENVISLADFTPEEAISVSDAVISDYSPAVYAAVLEEKPVSFYCPDGGKQGDVTYIDYKNELPGEIFSNQEELENYISIGKYAVSVTQNNFRKAFLVKADGKAAERIVDLAVSDQPLDFTLDVDPDIDQEEIAAENMQNATERE
ncbi:MAG: CDP-glycerol glycerophosphotransferase family protein [Eubacteriales bacterium]|nr:CDP-glycerol glycerophosphotransferase family protein [Eubacteriales bacterium]